MENIFEYLAEFSPVSARHRTKEIQHSLEILQFSPLIGCLIGKDIRKLLIGKRHSKFIATYRYDRSVDIVYIMHIRSERCAPGNS